VIALEKKCRIDPHFCFIIIARDEERHISACLDSILRQNYDSKSVEIIIVDTGSSDNTVEIVKKNYLKEYGSIVKLFTLQPKSNTKFIRSVARNFGVTQSSFHDCYIIFLDAHTILPSSNWLRTLTNYAKKWTIVSGPVVPPPELGPILRYHAPQEIKEYIIKFLITNSKEGKIFYGGNFCIHKSLFEKVGGFALVQRSEDILLLKSAQKKGALLISPEELYVYHFDSRLLRYDFWLRRMFFEGVYTKRFIRFKNLQRFVIIGSIILIAAFSPTLPLIWLIFLAVPLNIYLACMSWWIIKLIRFILKNRHLRLNLRIILILFLLGSIQAFVINIGKIIGEIQSIK
jgi:glycosyltransferase involved in cell wall biosynthesis